MDVIVIGAGPAGAVAMATLLRAGLSVRCYEAAEFPRFVIGESLLSRCNDLLDRAGLLSAVVARGYMVKRGATFARRDERTRICFTEGLPGDWPSTFQVPRDDFDQTLAGAARAMGADIRFSHRVEAVEATRGRARVSVRDVEADERLEVTARFVIDCSGYGRVLARLFDLEAPPGLRTRVSCFTHLEGDIAVPAGSEGDTWVVSHENGGTMWLIPFSNGRTSIGWIGDPAIYERYPGCDRERLAAITREDFAMSQVTAAAVPVIRTRSVSGYSRKVARWHGPGWAIAGNAGDFLDPVFSSGVSLAMESATLAAELCARELSGDEVDWQLEYDDTLRGALAVFQRLVETWHQGELQRLFYAPERVESVQRMIVSVLAGYALNRDNPLVRNPSATLNGILRLVG